MRLFLALALFLAGPVQANECRELLSAESYCNDYVETEALRNYPPVQRAHNQCLDFYRKVVEAAQLFCEYDQDAARLVAIGEGGRVKPRPGQRGLMQSAANLTGDARQTLASFRERAVFLLQGDSGIINLHQRSKESLEPLLRQGGDMLREEIHCQKNGRANAPPSFLLVGLATKALDDQQQTQNNFNLAIREFDSHLQLQLKGLRPIEAFNAASASKEGAMPGALGPAAAAESISSAENSAARRLVQGLVVRQPQDAVAGRFQSAVTAMHPSLGGEIAREVVRRGGKMVAGATTGTITKLIFGGRFDRLGLATLGIGMTVSALGITFWPGLVIAVSASWAEGKIRESWQREERMIAAPYLAWARSYLESNPAATSEQTARAWRPQKERSEFCGRCGNVNSGQVQSIPRCPARNSFNDNWYDSSSPFGTFPAPGRR